MALGFGSKQLEKQPVFDHVYDVESSTSAESYDHVFQDPVLCKYYTDLYEKTNYECRHHVDPELKWEPEEERKILLKNDWYVTFWGFVMFTALNFDRNNIKQAVSDTMLEDLGLTTNDYNLGNTINLVCFLAAELPFQLISKKLGSDIWIPIQMCVWSIVSLAQVALKGRASFLVTRALIGLWEGAFIADFCLWQSYFYTTLELPFRLSLFYISNPLTSVLSALLGAALLNISTPSIKSGWRWMFLIEGLLTLVIGVISFFKMPPSVTQTKTWYRKKGWYTDREERILVNKILRDDPTKGDMNNRQPVSFRELIVTLLDYDLLPIYLIRILGDVGTAPTNTYLTLTLRKLGFSTFRTNILSIPFNVITIIMMLLVGWFSEKWNSRALMIATTPIWILACLFPLRFWPGALKDAWGTFGLLTVLLGHSPIWALSISWCSANSNTVRTRAVSAAVVNIFSQLGAIISANVYQDSDKPLYHRGNEVLIGLAFSTVGACVFARYYYIFRNKQKEAAWAKLTPEQQETYHRETSDRGNKRLDFRFTY